MLPASVVAAAIGYTVLLVSLLARRCFAAQLPFELHFNGSRSLVCSRRDAGSSLVLAPDSSSASFARAIRLRNPYIDPMSLLQIELLKEWRAGDRRDTELERALFTAVKGVARGLMNTG